MVPALKTPRPVTRSPAVEPEHEYKSFGSISAMLTPMSSVVMPALKKAASKISSMGSKMSKNSGLSKLRQAVDKLTSKVFTSWAPSSKSKSKTGLRSNESESLVTGERRVEFNEHGSDMVPQELNQYKGGRPNQIRTAKFTMLTWLPLSLGWQFQRIANNYFLMIAVLVLALGKDSPKSWSSKIVPFVGVLFWTALKDLHEDRRRKQDDKSENEMTCKRFNPDNKEFVDVQFEQVLHGDVVWVQCDTAFPADLILLRSSGFDTYISTISLDGETNLKERRAPAVCDVFSDKPGDSKAGDAQDIKDKARTPTKNKSDDDEARALRYLHRAHAVGLTIKIGKPEVAVGAVKGSLRTDYTVEPCPISEANFLPRGCYLRNTAWILGVVVYAGDETKTRLNNAKVSSKFSNMQRHLNSCIWGLLVGLFALCLYAALRSVLMDCDREGTSFAFDMIWGGEAPEPWLKKLAIYMVTYYHVVPMSLYVCFEMLKLALGLRVNMDEQMVCPETGLGALARTADLVEEMGQVGFIFSDKTGTLTRNEMVFARCSIGGLDLGDFKPLEGSMGADLGDFKPPTAGSSHKGAEGTMNVRRLLGVPDAEGNGATLRDTAAASSGSGASAKDVGWFFSCLALCHTVNVEWCGAGEDQGKKNLSPRTSKKGRPEYLGASPDEVALVAAAHECGISFEQRTRTQGHATSEVTLQGPVDESRTYTILYELEFNSVRKRMSVVAQSKNEFVLVTKGADMVMTGLVTKPFCKGTQANLKLFSQQGLRTLVIASKVIDPEFFRNWEKEYRVALNQTDDTRDDEIMRIAANLEVGLTMSGISAVEDRLQDGVPDAIETLKQAGIRVWVLTGDKTETAVDIAHSCKLFTDDTVLAYAVNAEGLDETIEKLTKARNDLTSTSGEGGLVLDGVTIMHALPSAKCRQLIYEIGIASRCCVCCRLSPLQKRQLVELVRRRDPKVITLAIGDGANDVPMIEGAHVGIGVRGKEGAQAVQVSDVAVSQFRFLVPLLLCHGRRAYRRVALFLCYYLYKNVALAFSDIVWMHQNNFRTKRFDGGIAFPEYVSIGYNVLFTSWHVVVVLGWDDDIPDFVSNRHPEAYLVGPARTLFNMKVFGKWMCYSAYHGVICWLVPAMMISQDVIDGRVAYNKDEPNVFWVGSITSFTVLTVVVVLRLLIVAYGPMRWQALVPSGVAILFYLMVLFCLGYTPMGDIFQPCMKGIPGDMLGMSEGLLCLAVLPIAVLSVDFVDTMVCRRIWPTPLDIVRMSAYAEVDAKADEAPETQKSDSKPAVNSKADEAVVEVAVVDDTSRL